MTSAKIVGNLSLTSLRVFIAVVEEKSLTAAAAREHLVLPAVSKRVKELERELGVQLLYRSTRGVTLTQAGQALLVHARQIMGSLAGLRGELAEYSQGITGFVRIYVTTASVTQFLPEEISSFVKHHPLIKIELRDGSSNAIVRSVLDGTSDIGIIDSRTAIHGLLSVPYRKHRLVLIAAEKHPIAKSRNVDLEKIAKYDLIGTPSNSSLHALITRIAAEQGVSLKLRMQLRGLDGICRMIKAGLGLSILPEPAVLDNVKSMKLKALRIDGEWTDRESIICFRSQNDLPVAAKLLLRHLASQN